MQRGGEWNHSSFYKRLNCHIEEPHFRHEPGVETAVRWRVCLPVSWGWAMACQPDGLLLVRVLSLPAVVLWSAWWLMTTLWRARQADTGSPCLCVYVWERAFTCWAGGPSLVAFSTREPPPLGLLSCCSRSRRRGGGGGEVSEEETGVIERGQRGRSDTVHQETHTLWRDLFRRYSIWPLTGLFYSVKGTLCSFGEGT